MKDIERTGNFDFFTPDNSKEGMFKGHTFKRRLKDAKMQSLTLYTNISDIIDARRNCKMDVTFALCLSFVQ